jgi:hypothetical protein
LRFLSTCHKKKGARRQRTPKKWEASYYKSPFGRFLENKFPFSFFLSVIYDVGKATRCKDKNKKEV